MSTPPGEFLTPIDPSASETLGTHERAGAEGLREHPERPVVEPYLFSHNVGAPYAGSNFQGEQSAPAASCDDIVRDLRRLAASVRWVEAAARFPRGAQARHMPGFAPADGGRGYGEMFDNGFSSLQETEHLTPPSAMRSRRDTLHGPLIVLTVSIFVLIVSIFAAPIAYYFSAGSWGPTSKPLAEPQIASFDSKFITPPSRSSPNQEGSRPMFTRGDQPGSLADRKISSEVSELSLAAKSFARASVATLPPGPPEAPGPPLSAAVRAVDPDEIMLLMKQGEQFVAAGDVVTARFSFQRAAEAGDAPAALALAATYDPTILAKLGVMGIGADVEQARIWYRMAESYGSTEATQRLQFLDDH